MDNNQMYTAKMLQKVVEDLKLRIGYKGYNRISATFYIHPSENSGRQFNLSCDFMDVNDLTKYKTFTGDTPEEAVEKASSWLATLDTFQTALWKKRVRQIEEMRDDLRLAELDDLASLIDGILEPMRSNLLEGPQS